MVVRYIPNPPDGGLECMLEIIDTITSTTDPCYTTVASVTSTVTLPKITVSHCMDVVAVDVVPPVACITVYCSVSPADFPCPTFTWIVHRQCFSCVIGVLFK